MTKLTKRTIRTTDDEWSAILKRAAETDRKPAYVVRQLIHIHLMTSDKPQAPRLCDADLHETTSAAGVAQTPRESHNSGAAQRGGYPTSAAADTHGAIEDAPAGAPAPAAGAKIPSSPSSSQSTSEEEKKAAAAAAESPGFASHGVDADALTRELLVILNDDGGMGHELDAPGQHAHVEGRLTEETDGKAASVADIHLVVSFCANDWRETKWSSGLTLRNLLGVKFWDYLAMARGHRRQTTRIKQERESARAADAARAREQESREREDRERRRREHSARPPGPIDEELRRSMDRARTAHEKKQPDLLGPEGNSDNGR